MTTYIPRNEQSEKDQYQRYVSCLVPVHGGCCTAVDFGDPEGKIKGWWIHSFSEEIVPILSDDGKIIAYKKQPRFE